MKHTLLFIFGLFLSGTAMGQLNNSSFYNIYRLHPKDSNTLKLELNAMAFTKNHEYFNDIADGYTLFGYQLAPMLSYQPIKNFSITGGIFIRKDFGRDDYKLVEPAFRFTYQRDELQLIFGTLNGSLAHRLIEPLYDFDLSLVNPLENGIQARYFGESWWIDGWIDWQKMIYEGDPLQEEVTGGISFEKQFIKDSPVKVYFPIQALVYHKGGQIDSSPDPLITIWNSAVGLRLEGNAEGLIQRWQASAYYTYYRDFSQQKRQVFNDGEGLMINGSFTTGFDLQAMLSYWKGNEFISIMGGQLYPSISSTYKKPLAVEEQREFIILRLTHELHIFEGIYLTSRFEPYYDLGNKTFEFSHGLYINYRQPITLLKNVLK